MSITNLSFTSSSGETQLYYTLDSAESFTISSDSTSWLTVSVSNGVITVNVTNNESESDRTGHLTPKVGSETCSSKVITVLQDGSSPTPPAGSFEDLISNFNGILSDFRFNQITSNMDVYSYLYEGYMAASNEYNNENSPYFTQSTYEEVFKDGRSQWGSNNEYELDGTAKNAMLTWLMAMQLAEIVHTDATWVQVNGYDSYEVNVQTMFFKRAYDLFGNDGDGQIIPLYNSYTLKGDPMVARLAASAIYSTIRANHDFADIDDFMEELGGSRIDDSSKNAILGYNEWAYNSACTTANTSGSPVVLYYLSFPTDIGYNVNLNYILPPAAGPYVTANGTITDYMTAAQKQNFANRIDNCTNGKRHVRGRAYDLTNDATFKSQFYGSGQSNHYKNYNYKFDVDVDKYVCDNYNLVTGSNLSRTVQAVADANDDTEYLYLSNVYYKYSVGPSGCTYNGFYLVSSSDNNGNFSGPFNSSVLGTDLASKIKTGSTYSSLGKLLAWTHYASNDARNIILLHQYGRMRPGGANESGTDIQPRSTSNSNLNELGDSTISALAGGVTRYTNGTSPERWYVDTNYNYTQDSTEQGALQYYNGINVSVSPSCFNGKSPMRAHTYPSGHNAGVWAETMLMMELFPTRAQYIYAKGYSYGVSRTIVRAHWNSDTIYGRCVSMMTVPLVHAVTEVNGYNKKSEFIIENVCSYNFKDLFNCAKIEITGGTCSVQDGCGSSGDITFTLKIYNDLSVPVKLNGEMYMYMGNTDASTGKHCDADGIALDGVCKHGVQGNHISIPAGSNQSFSVTIPAATVALRGNVVSTYRADNVIFYSYGELLDSDSQYYKGEIARAFYAYPMDSTTATGSRITLVNGSTHFVHIPPNVTVTDLGQSKQYNQVSHYKNSSSQLTSAGDKYLW